MTSRDLRLIAALFQEPFASNAQLGRRLGVTGEAVRRRLAALREEGVLRRFVATPAPSIFGLEGFALGVDVGEATPADALALDGVVAAGKTLEGIIGLVGFVPAGAGDAAFRAWSEGLGASRVRYFTRYRPDVRPPPLGPLDWRVLDAILEEPRAGLDVLAQRTGLTARTVARRRAALVAQGVVEVTPLLGPSAAGRLFFHLALLGFEGSSELALKELPGTVLSERYEGAPSKSGLFLFCQVDSLPAQAELLARAARLPGVREVQPYLMTEYPIHVERLRGWIADRLRAWDGARLR